MSLNAEQLYDEVKAHQDATDSDDETMLRILCEFITKLDEDGYLPHTIDEELPIFIMDKLSRLPGDLS